MINKYLTYSNAMRGWIVAPVEQALQSRINGANLLKISNSESISAAADKKLGYSVNLINNNSKGYIEKKLSFKLKNLKYFQLLNEASMLEVFSKYEEKKTNGNFSITFPKILKFQNMDGSLILQREFIEGESVSNLKSEQLYRLTVEILDYLYQNGKTKFYKKGNFPKRGKAYITVSFLLYLIKSILKKPSEIMFLCSTAFLFYKARYDLRKVNSNLTLAHRDLHLDNILYSKKRAYIIDTEIACLAEPYTDLAITCRYLFKKLGKSYTDKIVSTFATTDTQRNFFKSLSIYYSVQCVATESSTDPFSKDAMRYMKKYLAS